MKKIIILILLLLSIGIAEAVNVSLTVSWSLSLSTVRPGGNLIIYLTASNPGLDLNGIILTATAGPYITLTSGSKIELGDMPATTSQQSSISIKVDKNAEATTSYVYLEAKYYYSNSEYKREFYVPITIKKEPVLEIINVDFNDTIEPGKTFSLAFDVSNKGDSTARDLKVKLNKTSLFTTPGSTGEIIIAELNPSESKTVDFLVTINPGADIGIESIPVNLSFMDDTKSNSYTQMNNIGLKVSGNIDFVVTVDSYTNFYYGRIGEVSISFSNRGLASAEYIQVIADSEFGSKEFYIGSLDSDDSETIDLPQNLAKASGKYPVHLTLNYRDKFDNEYSFEKTIEVTPNNAPLDYTTILIVIVVLAVIVYWIYKKRKK
ncbi:MAG: hypothetical protein GTN36_04805 [Candidatus Aenigmarchaeota archaeon]|nr:hypothetical protein [Candidatus Aenigmarchaeota archaeon]